MLGHPHRLAVIVAVLALAACGTTSHGTVQDTAAAHATPAVSANPGQPSAAAEQALSIDRFDGYWLGTTAPRGDVLREATVIIESEPGQAFTITWKNFGVANDGDGMVLRERTLRFVPTDNIGVWRAEGSGDPLGRFSSWATVTGDTLNIDVLAVDTSGRLERQTYRRTVSDDQMVLVYSRLRDGSADRIIEGTLVRLSED